MFKNLRKKKKGFTLIELIIVIAIIAILAAVAVPKFGDVRKNANVNADIATAKNVQNAVLIMLAEDTKKPGDEIKLEEITAAMGSKPKSKLDKANDFGVKIEADGRVIVKIGGVQVYPEPETTSDNIWYGGQKAKSRSK